MLMLYNSDNFVVVEHAVADGASVVDMREPSEIQARALDPDLLTRGGFEIVDKRSNKEVYLDGSWADAFQRQINAWQLNTPTQEEVEETLDGYAELAQNPLVMH